MDLVLPEGVKRRTGVYGKSVYKVTITPSPDNPKDIDIEGLLTLQEVVHGFYMNEGTPVSQGQGRLFTQFNRLLQSAAVCTSRAEKLELFVEAIRTLETIALNGRMGFSVELHIDPALTTATP